MSVEIHPVWKQAAVDLLSSDYSSGQIIPTKWFYDHLDLVMPNEATPAVVLKKTEFQFLDRFEKLRKHLLVTEQIDLRNVWGKGYEWVPVHKQTRTAFVDGYKTMRRGLRNMTERIQHVDRSKLSAEQLKENDEAMVRISKISTMMTSQRRLPKS